MWQELCVKPAHHYPSHTPYLYLSRPLINGSHRPLAALSLRQCLHLHCL